MASVRGAFLLAQNIETAFLAIGIHHEEALAFEGVFDWLALNEQAPTAPGMFFTHGVEGVIALDLDDVRIYGAVAGGGLDVFVATYQGVSGYLAGFPIQFLGGGPEQERKWQAEGEGPHLEAEYALKGAGYIARMT